MNERNNNWRQDNATEVFLAFVGNYAELRKYEYVYIMNKPP